MKQIGLPGVELGREVDGLEMGVMDDGTPFLTGRTLAGLCGVTPNAIFVPSRAWESGDRTGRLAQILVEAGFNGPSLYTPIMLRGVQANAYPDDVCMLFLEYFAFETRTPTEEAKANYRRLARAGLRAFIYRALGYDPQNRVPPRWRQFHDRLLLNPVPKGYFSVFREMADLVVFSIQRGLRVDSHTVPDISVGSVWSRHWAANGMDDVHGQRVKHLHVYPDYFPQAAANATIEAWVYPVAALGMFRTWMQEVYLPEKFPAYLEGKVKRRELPASVAEVILRALADGELTEGAPAPSLPAP